MTFFTRLRCRRCGQFTALWHMCRTVRKTRTPGYLPAPTELFPPHPVPRVTGKNFAENERYAIEKQGRYKYFMDAEAALPANPAPGNIRMTVQVPAPNHRAAQFAYDLGPQWTPESAYVFSHGHCHSLALALHEHGYKVMGVVSRHTKKQHQSEMSVHFFAVDPKDPAKGIDIYGRRPVATILEDFSMDVAFPVRNPHETFSDRVASGTLLPLNLDAGQRAASWVLARLNGSDINGA